MQNACFMSFCSSDILDNTVIASLSLFLNQQGLEHKDIHSSECCCAVNWAHWPTADLILLSLTVALLLPGPRRPCSRLTCLVTPCRLVLTSCITLAEPGVCFCFSLTLLSSKRMNKTISRVINLKKGRIKHVYTHHNQITPTLFSTGV